MYIDILNQFPFDDNNPFENETSQDTVYKLEELMDETK